MRKKIVWIIVLAIILASCMNVYADESVKYPERYDEYLQYLHEGWFSEGFTYEMWISAARRSEQLEQILENDLEEFTCVYTLYGDGTSDDGSYPDRSFSLKKGDILVTNGTSLAGITGHAGIAISNTRILHIAGPGYHPTTMLLYQWNNAYTKYDGSNTWTKFYRHTSTTCASDAADWAKNTYEGSDAEYDLAAGLSNTQYTYCSKIVWQAYKYGPTNAQATGSGFVLPYDLYYRIINIHLAKKIVGWT